MSGEPVRSDAALGLERLGDDGRASVSRRPPSRGTFTTRSPEYVSVLPPGAGARVAVPVRETGVVATVRVTVPSREPSGAGPDQTVSWVIVKEGPTKARISAGVSIAPSTAVRVALAATRGSAEPSSVAA